MHRRAFLCSLIGGVASLAGCAGSSNGENQPTVTQSGTADRGTTESTQTSPTGADVTQGQPTQTTTTQQCTPTPTPVPAADLWIRNEATTESRITVEVSNGDGDSLFNQTVALNAGEDAELSTGIFTEREGTFAINVSTDAGSNAMRSISVNARGTEGSIAIVERTGSGIEIHRQWVEFTPTPVGPDC